MGWKSFSIAGKFGINIAIICLLLILMMVMNRFFIGKILSFAMSTWNENIKFVLMAKEAETHVIQTQQWLTDISATREISRLFNMGDRAAASRLFEAFFAITDKLFALLDQLEEETNEAGKA